MQTKQSKPVGTVHTWFLITTIFITGNVIMMLEVVGTRVVGPFFGVGIYVWSALITVALLALATGYWLGGQWADARRRPEFLYLAILAAGLLTLVIPFLRNPLLTFAGNFGVRGGVLIGSALLFGPPLFMLGIVSPYATKLFTEQFEKLGSRVGLLYAISTVGSFMGTLTMGFYLIPNFRLSTILLSLGLGLLIMPLAYFLLIRSRRWPIFILCLLIGAALLVLFPRGAPLLKENIRIVYKTTSFYGEIKVVDVGSQRMLLVDGVTQSGEYFKTHQATPQYVKDMMTAIRRYHSQAQRALVIGLGGGNFVHALLQAGLAVDVVEIDKKIKAVATEYFGVDPQRVRITLDDGRRYVRNCTEQYDVVVCNTFNGESFPSHLLTREFFREVKSVLNPGGVMALNFVGYVQGQHRWAAAAVYATVHAENKWCHTFFREPKHRFANIVYIAGDGPELPEPQADPAWENLKEYAVTISGWETAEVCTDDYNPVEFLNRVVYRRWRQQVIDYLGPEVLLN